MKINYLKVIQAVFLFVIMPAFIFFTGYLSAPEKECLPCEPKYYHIEKDTIKEGIKAKQDSIFKVEFNKLPDETKQHYRHIIDSLTPWTNE